MVVSGALNMMAAWRGRSFHRSFGFDFDVLEEFDFLVL